MEAPFGAVGSLEFGWLNFLLGRGPEYDKENSLPSPQFIFGGKIICL